jgi:AraC-like DNA-binding protein
MRPSDTGESSPGYSEHRPPPALDGLVDYFWSLRDAPAHSRERVIPSGTLEMVINLHEDEFRIERPASTGTEGVRFRGAIASGAYERAFVVETRAHASIIGVHFKPGGAASILGVPAGDLMSQHVELEALWGRGAVTLRERLCAAMHTAQRFRILEQALVDRVSRCSNVQSLRGEVGVALARLGEPGVEVGDLARLVQLSHRRLLQLFTEQVGMTPKRYSRVLRFQRALRLATTREAPVWTRVAHECGYFDQAHLCHDFAEFTGFSPADLLVLRNVRVKDNHVALPEPARSNFSNTPCARDA